MKGVQRRQFSQADTDLDEHSGSGKWISSDWGLALFTRALEALFPQHGSGARFRLGGKSPLRRLGRV